MADDRRILAGLFLLSSLAWVVCPSLRIWRHSHPPGLPLLQPGSSKTTLVWSPEAPKDLSRKHVRRNAVESERVAGWVGLLLGDPLDLNAATTADLEALPGVGPFTAIAITRARQDLGRFRSPSGLLQAQGIGEKTLDRLKPWVKVTAPHR